MDPVDRGARSRPYRGIDASVRLAERRRKLLTAGLDLLGADRKDLSAVTVRGACRAANVATRYFYENFTDRDEFIGVVFDWVIADLVATTQATVMASPAREQTRAGMANIVTTIADDARIGRLLFSNQLTDAVIIRKRAESTALFALLSGQFAFNALRIAANERIEMGAHFAVGGVAQAISAWLSGDVRLDPEELIDQLTLMISELAQPRLYGLSLRASAAPATNPTRD